MAWHTSWYVRRRGVVTGDGGDLARSPCATMASSASRSVAVASTSGSPLAVSGPPAAGKRVLDGDQSQALQRARRADEAGDVVVGRARRGSGRAGRTARCWEPSRSTAMRSPSRMASSKSWVTKMIVLRSSRLQPQELVLQPLAGDRVGGAERLVHQHHRRVGGERAGDADPLLLAAGQLARVPRRGSSPASRPTSAEQLVDAVGDLRLDQPSSFGTTRDVLRRSVR